MSELAPNRSPGQLQARARETPRELAPETLHGQAREHVPEQPHGLLTQAAGLSPLAVWLVTGRGAAFDPYTGEALGRGAGAVDGAHREPAGQVQPAGAVETTGNPGQSPAGLEQNPAEPGEVAAVDGTGAPGGVRALPECRGYSPSQRAGLDVPRYCGLCGRRMIVQVLPAGWMATCSRHGSADSTLLDR